MPTIDLRPPCKELYCKSRASKRGFCEAHQNRVTEYNKIYDDKKRNKLKKAVYNSKKWVNLRAKLISDFPLCTRCKANKRIKVAQMVDHLVPFTDKNDFFAWSWDNLYPLCNQCHGEITPLERDNDFSNMPLKEAVFLKYQMTELREDNEINI